MHVYYIYYSRIHSEKNDSKKKKKKSSMLISRIISQYLTIIDVWYDHMADKWSSNIFFQILIFSS